MSLNGKKACLGGSVILIFCTSALIEHFFCCCKVIPLSVQCNDAAVTNVGITWDSAVQCSAVQCSAVWQDIPP